MGTLREIFAGMQKNQTKISKSKLFVTRSKFAVTFYRTSAAKVVYPPVQVILSTIKSPLALLSEFDVDSCSFCFAPAEQKVLATARGLRALRHGANIVDSYNVNPCYFRRLETRTPIHYTHIQKS